MERERVSSVFLGFKCQGLVQIFASGEDETAYVRAIKIDGQIAGCIAAFFETDIYRKNAEIAYWIAREYRLRGIMTQVIRRLAATLFTEFDIHRIWARPFADNIGSRRVLEKAGFEYEGLLKESVYKNGEYIDSVLYALVK